MRLLATALACLTACAPASATLPACDAIAPQLDAGLPADTVWGVADLHAHPAIEVAFDRALVWGSALDVGPLDPNELPRIEACPVESHTQPGATPLDRNIGSQLFPQIARVASFAHGPVGSLGYRPATAWPNARDVIHQQMNVASIRRAYEGGLRLMFASTTDNQVISALLTRIHFVDGFQPTATADYESAKQQLRFIRDLAAAHSSWLEVALTPAEARRIIRAGKLALVLSLEMDGLDDAQLASLWHDWGARHVFPIHLADNGFGGTAANADLYNAASAAVSAVYRSDGAPRRYLDVVPTRDFAPRLGWPLTLATLTPAPLYLTLGQVPYPTYASLCYEPLASCARDAAAPVTFTLFGQQNLRGLCTTREECLDGGRPGRDRLGALLDGGWLIDLSHMGARSVEETVALRPDYPFVASHGDVARLCHGAPAGCTDAAEGREHLSERSLDGPQARTVTRAQGVLGLGLGVGNFYTRPLVVARGAPLLTLASDGTRGCVAFGDSGTTCAVAPRFDGAALDAPLTSLQVETSGPGQEDEAGTLAARYVRVELRDAADAGGFQHRVVFEPLQCGPGGCSATVPLRTRQAPRQPPDSFCTEQVCVGGGCSEGAYTVDDVESVSLQWLFLSAAGDDGDSHSDPCRGVKSLKSKPLVWPIRGAMVTAPGAATGALVTLGPGGETPLVTLGGAQGASFELYRRRDRAPRLPARASGRLLQVKMTSSSKLGGASPQRAGANLCVAIRQWAAGVCQPAQPIPIGASECPPPWVSFNQRGQWDPSVELYTFVRWDAGESAVCGLDLAVLDLEGSAKPLTIDEVRVEAAEDPVGHWVRRYAEVARAAAAGRLGAVALGTDFNGLNGLIDISEEPLPAGAQLPAACGGGDRTLAPLRFRGSPEPVRLDERGLATYGLLQDFIAIVERYPSCGRDVRNSLLLSAEATLRAWEKTRGEPDRPPLPTAAFDCGAGP